MPTCSAYTAQAALARGDLAAVGTSGHREAARLFVSPQTVQTHLTNVYSNLGLTSRVQLAQEAPDAAADPPGQQLAAMSVIIPRDQGSPML